MIDNFSFDVAIHHICCVCNTYIGVGNFSPDEEKDNIFFCNNCNNQIDEKENIKSGNIFLYISLMEQLKAKFSLEEDLSVYSHQRKKKNEDSIEDILDGELYKINYDPSIVTITFNIDGVPIFEHSRYSGTPILCTMNEVHPKKKKTTYYARRCVV